MCDWAAELKLEVVGTVVPGHSIPADMFPNLVGAKMGEEEDHMPIIATADADIAKRLAACWNLCSGISTAELEKAGSFEELVKRLTPNIQGKGRE